VRKFFSGGEAYNSLKQKTAPSENGSKARNPHPLRAPEISGIASRRFKKPISLPALGIITHTFLTL